jgi:WD40 repeat protein
MANGCIPLVRTTRSRPGLRGHTDRVLSLALSSGGKRLYSAGHDKSIQLWDLDG